MRTKFNNNTQKNSKGSKIKLDIITCKCWSSKEHLHWLQVHHLHGSFAVTLSGIRIFLNQLIQQIKISFG